MICYTTSTLAFIHHPHRRKYISSHFLYEAYLLCKVNENIEWVWEFENPISYESNLLRIMYYGSLNLPHNDSNDAILDSFVVNMDKIKIFVDGDTKYYYVLFPSMSTIDDLMTNSSNCLILI